MDDPEVSDGASENEYSDHELEAGKEEDDNPDMADQKFTETDENGKVVVSVATKPKLDPKDPLRPRRKKARRACFACQRAHLTCGMFRYSHYIFLTINGSVHLLDNHSIILPFVYLAHSSCATANINIGDERPCQRCIKRGLAEACQDGVRKKAKYLHDAPPEALRPVLGPNYQHPNNGRSNNGNNTTATSTSDTSPAINSAFFSQADNSPSYPIFAASRSNAMPPPLQNRLSYGSQQSPVSPTFQNPIRQNSMQGISMPQVTNDVQNSFGGALFDPSNPALFNFDLEGLNFGNHYGALEFGMLGHMSSGAAETPPKDNNGSISSQGMGDVNFYGGNMNQFGQMYPQDMLPDFGGNVDRNNQMFANNVHHGLPHAYAIATGPASHHSPSTDASPSGSGMFENSPNGNNYTPNTTPLDRPQRPAKRQESKTGTASKFGPASILGKRTRDPSSIYDTVHEPYSYTAGFHGLTAYLQRRFSATKTLRIAKSLASIRPSFISCTKTLNRQDLIFMEKCFQRTLFEYEDFMLNCCTPTIVCRRTGEIAAVNKEFTLMTGWKKDVLLGAEPNLNVNNGRGASDNTSTSSLGGTGRAGLTTPRMRPLSLADTHPSSRPQPVFLAELMDDDSVVEFYEDFARLAFGDSRGSVTTRCKLLKYQSKDAASASPEAAVKEEVVKKKAPDLSAGGRDWRYGEPREGD